MMVNGCRSRLPHQPLTMNHQPFPLSVESVFQNAHIFSLHIFAESGRMARFLRIPKVDNNIFFSFLTLSSPSMGGLSFCLGSRAGSMDSSGDGVRRACCRGCLTRKPTTRIRIVGDQDSAFVGGRSLLPVSQGISSQAHETAGQRHQAPRLGGNCSARFRAYRCRVPGGSGRSRQATFGPGLSWRTGILLTQPSDLTSGLRGTGVMRHDTVTCEDDHTRQGPQREFALWAIYTFPRLRGTSTLLLW